MSKDFVILVWHGELLVSSLVLLGYIHFLFFYNLNGINIRPFPACYFHFVLLFIWNIYNGVLGLLFLVYWFISALNNLF